MNDTKQAQNDVHCSYYLYRYCLKRKDHYMAGHYVIIPIYISTEKLDPTFYTSDTTRKEI